MTDQPENIVLERLRLLRTDMAARFDKLASQVETLTSEVRINNSHVAGIVQSDVLTSQRMPSWNPDWIASNAGSSSTTRNSVSRDNRRMTAMTNELIYEVLKSLQAQVAITREEVAFIKARLTSFDRHFLKQNSPYTNKA